MLSLLIALALQDGAFRPDPEMPAYTLPDPLAGVTHAGDGTARPRPELLELFRAHVYGRVPATPFERRVDVVERNAEALGGTATLKRAELTLTRGAESLRIRVSLFTPKRGQPSPVFLLICNRPESNIDPTRATKSAFWPVEEAVARGYGLAAFHVGDVDPDRHDGFKDGAHRLLDVAPRGPDAWGTIAAWAWGASRVLDWLVAHNRIESSDTQTWYDRLVDGWARAVNRIGQV